MNWSWKTPDLMILLSFIGICFTLSAFITIYHEDNVYTIDEKLVLIFNILGLCGLMFLQIINKWFFGIIVISILLLINSYRILNSFHII
jgi:hypothetical protein